LSLSTPKVPDGHTRKAFEAWNEFIGGAWLEVWIESLIKNLGVGGVTECSVGVNCTRGKANRPFEVDVAVMRGHRPYFISCTTDTTLNICKSKAFEITVRARQMGGDLARSALVCLLLGEDKRGKYIEQLRADVNDVWTATNTTQIFGLEDVREWAGHHTYRPAT
jgi:hypothetical protein